MVVQGRVQFRHLFYGLIAENRSHCFGTAGGGELGRLVGLNLAVPSDHMGRLEDGFMVLAHILAYAFMEGAVI